MNTLRILGTVFLMLVATTLWEAQAMADTQVLDARQQAIIPIAAFTASGDLERLKPALSAGLDSGLNVNEVKEILTQMYAYAGFPRSLNGLSVLASVLEERKAKSIVDSAGKEASPIPADLNRDEYGAKVRARLWGMDEIPPPAPWQLFAPTADRFLKEHLFADIFARDILTFQDRELATVAALAAIPGTGAQLRAHLSAAMHTGLSPMQMQGYVAVLKAKVDEAQADAAAKLLGEVLAVRGK